MKQTQKKMLVQLEFAPDAAARLNALRSKIEATSYAEVVKNALRLYEALIIESEIGTEFFARDKSGVISPYKMFK